jgi:hypothetical protein
LRSFSWFLLFDLEVPSSLLPFTIALAIDRQQSVPENVLANFFPQDLAVVASGAEVNAAKNTRILDFLHCG